MNIFELIFKYFLESFLIGDHFKLPNRQLKLKIIYKKKTLIINNSKHLKKYKYKLPKTIPNENKKESNLNNIKTTPKQNKNNPYK